MDARLKSSSPPVSLRALTSAVDTSPCAAAPWRRATPLDTRTTQHQSSHAHSRRVQMCAVRPRASHKLHTQSPRLGGSSAYAARSSDASRPAAPSPHGHIVHCSARVRPLVRLRGMEPESGVTRRAPARVHHGRRPGRTHPPPLDDRICALTSSPSSTSATVFMAESFNQQLGGAWSTSTASKVNMFYNCPGSIV